MSFNNDIFIKTLVHKFGKGSVYIYLSIFDFLQNSEYTKEKQFCTTLEYMSVQYGLKPYEMYNLLHYCTEMNMVILCTNYGLSEIQDMEFSGNLDLNMSLHLPEDAPVLIYSTSPVASLQKFTGQNPDKWTRMSFRHSGENVSYRDSIDYLLSCTYSIYNILNSINYNISNISGGKKKTKQTKKTPNDPIVEEAFKRFWVAYPKKIHKQRCLSLFKSNNLTNVIDDIVEHVEAMKKTNNWMKDDGQFIPHPSSYITQRRWEDVVEAPKVDTSDMSTWRVR